MANVNKRLLCLKESRKLGLTLVLDPFGTQNRCFYNCVGKFFGIDDEEVVNMVEEYMISNQIVDIINEANDFMAVVFPLLSFCNEEMLATSIKESQIFKEF